MRWIWFRLKCLFKGHNYQIAGWGSMYFVYCAICGQIFSRFMIPPPPHVPDTDEETCSHSHHTIN